MSPLARATLAALLGVAGALLSAAPVRAADEFESLGVNPPIDPYGYVQVSGSRSLEPLQPHASVTYDWSHKPLSFDVGGAKDFEFNEDMDTLALAAGIGVVKLPTGNCEVGLALPIVLDREGVNRHDFHPEHEGGLGGDLRMDAKATIQDVEEGVFGEACRVWAYAPTGAEGRFISSDDSWRIGFESILEAKIDWFRGGLTLGWEWLDGKFRGPSGTVDDRFLVGFALAVAPLRDIAGFEPLEVGFELRHWTNAAHPWDHEATSPFEAAGMIRYGGTVFGALSAGGRLNKGLGAPDARVEASIGFTY